MIQLDRSRRSQRPRVPSGVWIGALTAVVLIVPVVALAADVGTIVTDIALNAMKPIIQFLGEVEVALTHILLTIIQYNDFLHAKAVERGWVIVRDVGNMFFIVALLVIAFGSILRIQGYRYNQWLFRIVLMALLVNFSKTIAGFFIDVGQVVALTFVNAFKDTMAGNFAQLFGLTEILKLRSGVDSSSTGGSTSLIVTYLLAIVLLLVAVGVTLAYVIVFLVRIVALWLLVIVSPMAYVLNTFKQTEGYARRWWSEFGRYVTIGPVLAFFLWLALALAGGTGDGNVLQSDLTKSAGNLSALEQTEQSGIVAQAGQAGADSVSVALSTIGQSQNLLGFLAGTTMLVAALMFVGRSGIWGARFAASVPSRAGRIGVRASRNPWVQRATGFAVGGVGGLAAVQALRGGVTATRAGIRTGAGALQRAGYSISEGAARVPGAVVRGLGRGAAGLVTAKVTTEEGIAREAKRLQDRAKGLKKPEQQQERQKLEMQARDMLAHRGVIAETLTAQSSKEAEKKRTSILEGAEKFAQRAAIPGTLPALSRLRGERFAAEAKHKAEITNLGPQELANIINSLTLTEDGRARRKLAIERVIKEGLYAAAGFTGENAGKLVSEYRKLAGEFTTQSSRKILMPNGETKDAPWIEYNYADPDAAGVLREAEKKFPVNGREYMQFDALAGKAGADAKATMDRIKSEKKDYEKDPAYIDAKSEFDSKYDTGILAQFFRGKSVRDIADMSSVAATNDNLMRALAAHYTSLNDNARNQFDRDVNAAIRDAVAKHVGSHPLDIPIRDSVRQKYSPEAAAFQRSADSIETVRTVVNEPVKAGEDLRRQFEGLAESIGSLRENLRTAFAQGPTGEVKRNAFASEELLDEQFSLVKRSVDELEELEKQARQEGARATLRPVFVQDIQRNAASILNALKAKEEPKTPPAAGSVGGRSGTPPPSEPGSLPTRPSRPTNPADSEGMLGLIDSSGPPYQPGSEDRE